MASPSTGPTIHHAALAAGRRIGRYEILGVLGQGGFGITYRARDTQLGRDVAVKEYLPTSLAIRQDGTTVLPRSTDVADDFVWGRDRFIAEGHTLASLDEAPAIVRVFDFLEANGTAYIIMELLRGETLEARIGARGPLPPAEVDALLRPLLDGLEHVHAAGFLHRDIKPGNILLKANGAPTLIDFGASRAAIAGRTAAMTAIFTPGYAAAEQFTSAKQGPWSDIYGLAATIHCAITGKPPPSAFDRMLDDDYQPLARLRPAGFAPSLLAGIDAALVVRAADRPQSIAQWRAILDDASVATVALPRPRPAEEATPPPPPPPPPAAGAKRPVALYAGAALVVLLLAIGGWFVLSPSSPQRSALQDMKVEDLERALAERRKADAETAEKRRLEEEAQRKAAADALAKQAADAELERAQAERQKAEQELAQVKAALEAQLKAAAAQRDQAEAAAQRAAAEEAERRAQAEANARRRAEEEARRKAVAEAQAKQQADEALAKAQAERQKAEGEARLKAEAEARQMAEASAKQKAEAEAAEAAAAKAASEAADRKAAEAAEAALKLAPVDRQRLQAALTSLDFDTRGTDGAFGPRSREMIAGWQKARSLPPTGYLNAAQQQTLLREGAAAVGKFDDEQKKLEEKKADEAKKKAEDEAKEKAKAAVAPPAAPAPTTAPAMAGGFDGEYSGGLFQNAPGGMGKVYTVTMTIAGGRATGEAVNKTCGSFPIALSVAPSGEISGPFQIAEQGQQVCARLTSHVTGRVSNGKVEIDVRSAGVSARGSLTKR